MRMPRARTRGAAAIARYYAHAPRILARISAQTRTATLLSVYARFVLPAAIAARLGLNAHAYRLYVRMLDELAPDMDVHAKARPYSAKTLASPH